MSGTIDNLDMMLSGAVRHFWKTRGTQSQKQGGISGRRDQGQRNAVTGGKQMDGFVNIVKNLLLDAGIAKFAIFCQNKLELPGFFRPEKKWDLLVVVDGNLLATVEFKSHVGPSFGNNYNNRTEEALGSATDLWTAYREGAFQLSQRPWLGYLMLLEEAAGSIEPVHVREPHFPVREEFRSASYVQRYELLLGKLVRERLYDAACFLVSSHAGGQRGTYREPSPELTFRNLATSLLARAMAYVQANR